MWRLLNLTKPSKLIQLLRCFGSEMNHAEIVIPPEWQAKLDQPAQLPHLIRALYPM
jgi:hypothetical protein